MSTGKRFACLLVGLLALVPLLHTTGPLAARVAQAASHVLCVDDSGGATRTPCFNSVAYSTIQAAIDAAEGGDEIRIAAGTYTPTRTDIASYLAVLISKPLALRGGYQSGNWSTATTSTTTVLDGQDFWGGILVGGSYPVTTTITVENLTVRHGRAGFGAGVWQEVPATVVLSNTIFRDNQAGSGGALIMGGRGSRIIHSRLISNTATFEDCGALTGLGTLVSDSEIAYNRAARHGGGACDGSFERVRIHHNEVGLVGNTSNNDVRSGDGGGIYGSGILTDTEVFSNVAYGTGGGLAGGFVVTGGRIEGNRTAIQPASGIGGSGGGVAGAGVFVRTRIVNNQSIKGGGGIAQVSIYGQDNVTLIDCDVINNSAASGPGGGLILVGASVVSNTVVSNNRASGDGGGIVQLIPGRPGSLRLVNSVVENNAAEGNGGGIYLADPVQTVVSATSVLMNRAGRGGGGLYQSDPSGSGGASLSISRSRIEGNIARGGQGGGLRVTSALTLTASTVMSNTASAEGGGIYKRISYGDYVNNTLRSRALLVASVLADNRSGLAGDGIFVRNNDQAYPSPVVLINVTLANAQRAPHAAIDVAVVPLRDGTTAPTPTLTLSNTAVVNYALAISRTARLTILGNYNALFGNGSDQQVEGVGAALPFSHLLRADPRFVDLASRNYHLRADSPLIDAGDPAGSYKAQLDIDGEPVPRGLPDIGADEAGQLVLRHTAYLPLVAR